MGAKRKKPQNRPKVDFSSVSIPKPVLEEVDELIRELGHWPSRSAFVRESVLEKVRVEKQRIKG